jgi:hypothetical protein
MGKNRNISLYKKIWPYLSLFLSVATADEPLYISWLERFGRFVSYYSASHLNVSINDSKIIFKTIHSFYQATTTSRILHSLSMKSITVSAIFQTSM